MSNCAKCHGTGWWQYDHNHSTVCNECCRHDKGVWPLIPGTSYGYSAGIGDWCCLAGCGMKWSGIVDYQKAVK